MAKPEGSGPFPAIVIMPGCTGLTTYIKEDLPQLLVSWGYVALVVDSLTTRKVEPNCLKDSASVDRMADAYGGLFYLAGLSFVNRNRVGVLGVGIGGRVPLVLAETQTDAAISNPGKLTFKAGVAYYPTCTVSKEEPTFPLLIMIGRKDQSTHAWTCEELVANRASNTVPTELTVYPEAHHGFIERDWSTPHEAYGARYEFNEKAAEDSLRRAQEFLARNVEG
jgi:dienelactone hydrolase